MPFPGPPAEKLPPPPINMLMTQKVMKSGSRCDADSSARTTCARFGIGVGPNDMFDKSLVTWKAIKVELITNDRKIRR